MDVYNALKIYFNALKKQGYYPYKDTLGLASFIALHKTIENFKGCMSNEELTKYTKILECWGSNLCGVVSPFEC